MINLSAWGRKTKLANAVSTTDTTIKIASGAGVLFAIPVGSYYYATIFTGSAREFVKVTATNGDTLVVERGQDGSTPTAFAGGACIKVEWNPAQLCEFVRAGCSAPSEPTVPPGVYCGCDTCFEIDRNGRIVAINGGQSCP